MASGGLIASMRTSLLRAGLAQIGLVAAVLALSWAFLLGDLRQEYRDSVAGAQRETKSLAQGLGETTLVSFNAIDAALIQLRDDYKRERDHGFDAAEWLRRRGANDGLVIQASITNRDGVMVSGSLPFAPGTSLADREHVRFQRDSSDDQMFISQPVLGRVSNKKSLNITRKIIAPDGSYDGVVVLSVGLDYVTHFYESLTEGRVIEMVGSHDGIIRARAPVDNELIGTREPALASMHGETGSVLTTNPDGSVDRIFSYRSLGKYPLTLVVELNSAEVFAQYNRDARRYHIAGGLLSLLFIAAGAVMVRQRRRLLASRAALSATLENITQGILMEDASGRVPVINRRAIELLDLPPELVAGQPRFRDIISYQLATREFGDADSVDPAFLNFIQTGGTDPAFSSYERTRPDGTALEVRTQMLPDGGAVRTYSDVTDRKRTSEALAAARDAAEAGVRARAEFIAVMSHEIRTPLNGILGVAELLRGLELDPTAAEYVDVINSSGQHLLQIINDILDFSRLDAVRLDLEYGVFNVRETIRQVVSLLGPQAEAKALELTCDIADTVPEFAYGDAQRLRQVLLNLAGNGVKFTQRGSVAIRVRLIVEDERGVRLGFSVADTGMGISAEAQGRLFQEFTQVDSSISRRFGGSGLGLVIARRLVALMDGGISVESTPGVGSIFRFDVKLRHVPATQTRAAIGAAGATERVPDTEPPRGLKILLAEDNATNRFVASRMLEKLGHTVTSVVDGVAAVAAATEGGYDVVLMDMMMPEMDGLAATRVIRDLPGAACRVPIIGLTANAMKSDEEACMEAGMDGFVTKPAKAAELESAMREAISRRNAPRPYVRRTPRE